MQETMYKRGDHVIHPLRPEWGPGVVCQVAPILHEGKSAQRLVVDFSNHGRVTLNTGIAQLVTKESYSAMSMSTHSAHSLTSAAPQAKTTRGWLDTLDPSNQGVSELWRLPEAMTDPFAPMGKKLSATLDSFKFGIDPRHARNLLDWAIAQTGLRDPMTKYTRHELELGFRRFVRDRDNHILELVKTLKRSGKYDVLDQVRQATTDPLAKTTLERIVKG
jgi:hypothetical protein